MGRETYKDIAKGEWNAALLEEQKIFKYIDKLKEECYCGMKATAVIPDSVISYIMAEFDHDFDLAARYLNKWRKENEEE